MNAFLDTNILIYSLEQDLRRASIANDLIGRGGIISVQVLNEAANVLSGKLRRDWKETDEALAAFRQALEIVPMTLGVHLSGMDLSNRHRLSIYDAMIVAAAMEAGCETLYSEDMHAGLIVDGRLTIVNPFV